MAAAWMIRDLGQAVSAIHIDQEGGILAGGWDGRLKRWDKDGTTLWQVDCNDRIETILEHQNTIFVTSGLHIMSIIDGEIAWSFALEGSSDLLVIHNDTLVATSSVFDIEHNDFMESAIWTFSLDGELLDVVKIDERPWFIESKDQLVIALGRPRCGVLIDGKHEDLASESPVTCGLSANKMTLYGHADGTVSNSEGNIIAEEASSVESLSANTNAYFTALENGTIVSRGFEGKQNWQEKGSQITCHVSGFDNTHWCGRWETIAGKLEVRDLEGTIISEIKTARPRVAIGTESRVSVGFEDGQIVVWEKDLFSRRSSENPQSSDERKSALAAKLRSLRK